MRRQVATALKRIRIDATEISSFLGCWLTEPKPLVRFDPPGHLARSAFARRIARNGVALDRRTQMLYDRTTLYVNGEAMALPRTDAASLVRLADRRRLPAGACGRLAPTTLALLHGWHHHGYLELTS
jgi:50S ribosomal protein L16 3-hydroxylase